MKKTFLSFILVVCFQPNPIFSQSNDLFKDLIYLADCDLLSFTFKAVELKFSYLKETTSSLGDTIYIFSKVISPGTPRARTVLLSYCEFNSGGNPQIMYSSPMNLNLVFQKSLINYGFGRIFCRNISITKNCFESLFYEFSIDTFLQNSNGEKKPYYIASINKK